MTDTEILDAIRKIIRARPRRMGTSLASIAGAAIGQDLNKYDQIVGLVHDWTEAAAAPKGRDRKRLAREDAPR